MRQQLNIRVDDDLLRAIDDIRRLSVPVPTVTDAIRQAVLNERSRMLEELKRQARAATERRNALSDLDGALEA